MFLTDKDVGQIDAIKDVFRITPMLCIWHMKRSVKQKIKELRLPPIKKERKKERTQRSIRVAMFESRN